jgi:hypothetical protein
MSDACMIHLNKLIIQVKKQKWERETGDINENANGISSYMEELTELYEQLNRAISNEDIQALQALQWPAELMDCIKDMSIRYEIVDCIKQAFTVHYFNRSPEHEEELRKENEGLL